MSDPEVTSPVPTRSSFQVPQWMWLVAALGGGTLAGGGGSAAAGIFGGASAASVAALEARMEDLEDEVADQADTLGTVRDNQLLICVALEVECAR